MVFDCPRAHIFPKSDNDLTSYTTPTHHHHSRVRTMWAFIRLGLIY
jgi:hypothetical protein